MQNFGICVQCVMADNNLVNMTCSGQVRPSGMHITALGSYGENAVMPNLFMELLNNNQSYSAGLHVGGGIFPYPAVPNSTRLTFGVAVRNNRHTNPPPHEYLDNSAQGCTNNNGPTACLSNPGAPGQLTASAGTQSLLLEANRIEERSDINYSQGYTTINVDPGVTTVVERDNVVTSPGGSLKHDDIAHLTCGARGRHQWSAISWETTCSADPHGQQRVTGSSGNFSCTSAKNVVPMVVSGLGTAESSPLCDIDPARLAGRNASCNPFIWKAGNVGKCAACERTVL